MPAWEEQAGNFACSMPKLLQCAAVAPASKVLAEQQKLQVCDLQVKLQENARDVEAHSCGGTITCKVPPSFGALQAALEPWSSVTLGEGVHFQVKTLQKTCICL